MVLFCGKRCGCKKYCEKIKNFTIRPRKAFEAETKTSFTDAAKYMLLFGIVFSVLTAVISIIISPELTAAATLPESAVVFIMLAVMAYIINILRSVVGGLWLYVWAYIFSARKGVGQTLKASIYGDTPFYIIGWIPYINLAALVWSLVLKIVGLMKLQGMGKYKATAAVIIATIISIILVIVLALYLIEFLPPELITEGLTAEMTTV